MSEQMPARASTIAEGREWLVIWDGPATASVRVLAEPMSTVVPELEYHLAELELPWDADWQDAGAALLREAAALVPPSLVLDARLNAELHDHLDERRRLLEDSGFRLFQEKQGFGWHDDGRAIRAPARLSLRAVADVGRDTYMAMMGRCGEGTLDLNDRYYWGRCGPAGWAEEMLGYLRPGDESSWLIGYEAGEPAGFVAVSASDRDGVATIVHIGVVPERRGRGLIDELLAAGMRAARARGFHAMLSDVDVANAPMLAAMERAGQAPPTSPWHVWHYRLLGGSKGACAD